MTVSQEGGEHAYIHSTACQPCPDGVRYPASGGILLRGGGPSGSQGEHQVPRGGGGIHGPMQHKGGIRNGCVMGKIE